jgi:hypothetical protein
MADRFGRGRAGYSEGGLIPIRCPGENPGYRPTEAALLSVPLFKEAKQVVLENRLRPQTMPTVQERRGLCGQIQLDHVAAEL